MPMTGVPNHDLDKLWRQLRPYVEARFNSAPEYPRIPEIEKILADFVSVDQSSFAFRYETDKNGNATLTELANVNVVLLQERANLLYSLLDTIDGVFSGDWDGRQNNDMHRPGDVGRAKTKFKIKPK